MSKMKKVLMLVLLLVGVGGVWGQAGPDGGWNWGESGNEMIAGGWGNSPYADVFRQGDQIQVGYGKESDGSFWQIQIEGTGLSQNAGQIAIENKLRSLGFGAIPTIEEWAWSASNGGAVPSGYDSARVTAPYSDPELSGVGALTASCTGVCEVLFNGVLLVGLGVLVIIGVLAAVRKLASGFK